MDSIPAAELNLAQWRRVCLGHGIKLGTSTGHVYKYDGFRDTVSVFSTHRTDLQGPCKFIKLCAYRKAVVLHYLKFRRLIGLLEFFFLFVFSGCCLYFSFRNILKHNLSSWLCFLFLGNNCYLTQRRTKPQWNITEWHTAGLFMAVFMTKDVTQVRGLRINNFHPTFDIFTGKMLPSCKKGHLSGCVYVCARCYQKYVNESALLPKAPNGINEGNQC